MNKQHFSFADADRFFRFFLKWIVLILIPACVTGSLVALFLWLLDVVTNIRWQHSWLLWLLPAAGLLIHWMYRLWGKLSEQGNNLILDEIHQPGAGVPPAMAPLVILSTWITHLFGGSAGREGTAVQVGGSIASLAGKWLKLRHEELRILLMTGIAAGFGAVFGTPVAAAVFALEVLSLGRVRYDALIPCLLAAIAADITTRCWGIHHTVYLIRYQGNTAGYFPSFNSTLLLQTAVAGILFGFTSRLFVWLSHGIKKQAAVLIRVNWLIPVSGALIIILLRYLCGTTDYLGLGVLPEHGNSVSILTAFGSTDISPWSWLWKLLFTAVTLGMGFKGGEVTPLFFIGATLGHTLSQYMGMPVDLLAGLGFIAVFAGATNTPLACTLMGVELFGGTHILYYAVACFLAYYSSGRHGIYSSQQHNWSKTGMKH